MNTQIDVNRLLAKLEQLYPRELNHAVAECRADALQARVDELEDHIREETAPRAVPDDDQEKAS